MQGANHTGSQIHWVDDFHGIGMCSMSVMSTIKDTYGGMGPNGTRALRLQRQISISSRGPVWCLFPSILIQ